MRPRRHLIDGAKYHVIARANRGEFILERVGLKEMFLGIVASAKRRYRFSLESLCIMDSHVHMIVVPGKGESLSRIMQWILSVFAIRFNRIHKYRGHVWYDRFKSKIIFSMKQYVETCEYIANNPVKAGLVDRPEDYRYAGVPGGRIGCGGVYDVLDPPDG